MEQNDPCLSRHLYSKVKEVKNPPRTIAKSDIHQKSLESLYTQVGYFGSMQEINLFSPTIINITIFNLLEVLLCCGPVSFFCLVKGLQLEIGLLYHTNYIQFTLHCAFVYFFLFLQFQVQLKCYLTTYSKLEAYKLFYLQPVCKCKECQCLVYEDVVQVLIIQQMNMFRPT